MSLNSIERQGSVKVFVASFLLLFFTGAVAVGHLSVSQMTLEKSIFHYLDSAWYLTKPFEYINDTNDTITRASGVVYYQTFHNLFYVIVTSVTFCVVSMYRRQRALEKKEEQAPLLSPLVESFTKIKLGKGKSHDERWIENPFGTHSISIRPIPGKRRFSLGSIEALEDILLRLLYEYRDVPASIDGYHGSENLFAHSCRVAKRMQEYGEERNNVDPLLGAIGLSHDLEKIFAYTKDKTGKWFRKAYHFQQFGGVILKSLPEYKALNEVDRVCLARVLHYKHSSGLLPYDLTQRQRDLLSLLKKADSSATRQEQKAEKTNTAELKEKNALFAASLLETIANLSVNQPDGSNRYEGWYRPSDTYFITTIENIRIHLFNTSRSDDIQRYQLGVPLKKNTTHPFTTFAIATLRDARLLVESIGGIDAIEGVFSGRIKTSSSDKKLLSNIVLLNRNQFENRFPGTMARWGSMKFQFRITNTAKVDS